MRISELEVFRPGMKLSKKYINTLFVHHHTPMDNPHNAHKRNTSMEDSIDLVSTINFAIRDNKNCYKSNIETPTAM